MKKKILKNRIIPVIMLVFLLHSNFGQIAYSQVVHTGVIWVVPNRPDAFPVNGNRTGNAGLNIAFEDFHVIEYAFLDSIYITGLLYKQPIYQIRLDDQFTDVEYEFVLLLRNCYPGFFIDFTLPYYNPFFGEQQTLTTDNGMITLLFFYSFDFSLIPKSNTRSYNKHMNLILRNYDIKSYTYDPFVLNSGDTIWRTIEIICQYQDLLPLYYDLLSKSHLYDAIGASAFMIFGDSSNPCGSYSGISDEEEPSLTIFPNPAQNEIFVLGVNPKSIIVYDVMGNNVITEFDAENNKIDIKNLPNGLYIIEILSEKGDVLTSKFIK